MERNSSKCLVAALRSALLAGLGLLAVPAAADHIALEARPVVAERTGLHALVAFESGPTLTLTGAWRLTSTDPRFGGFSAVLAQDDELLLVSDRGSVLRLPGITRGMPGRGEFLDMPPDCLAAGKWGIGDAESVALSPDGSAVMVAMERSNALCLFDPDDPQSGRLLRPDALSHWKRNRGAETMATLAGKGTAIIGEARSPGGKGRPLLWFGEAPGDAPPLRERRYLPGKGYKPADAAFLADGRMLVLDRASGLRRGKPARLSIVHDFDPEGSEEVSGVHLANIGEGALAASYEGIAAVPGENGTHVVWLVSDDNFSSGGGTLLLRLLLQDKTGQPTVIAGHRAQGASQGRAEP